MLAHAAEMLGSKLTTEKAGTFYFLIPKPEEAADKGEAESEPGT